MGLLISIVIWGLLGLWACNNNEIPENTTVEIYSEEDAREICMFYGHDPDVAACTQIYGDRYHIVTNGDPDCLEHELTHIEKGDWHPGRKAECWERPE
jgi:hypothetical protein